MVQEGAQCRAGLLPHGCDGPLPGRPCGGQLVQHLFEIARRDPGCGKLRAELGGRVRELRKDAVQCRTGATGIDACIGELADDRDGCL
ncbi:hypothetical protein D3C71_1786560 [compost metagenome]